MRFFVRAARLTDAPEMARVIIDTGREAHRGQVPDALLFSPPLVQAYADSERNWRRALREIQSAETPDSCVYVTANDDDVAVGLAMGAPPRETAFLTGCAEVHVLYVRPAHQGRGLGRRLLQAVAAHMAGLGNRALIVGCLAANEPARKFYEALGGRLIGERPYVMENFSTPEVIYGWEDLSALSER